MTQPGFAFSRDEILPHDSHVVEPTEVRRLAGQCEVMLARLQRGPATNTELAALSLKYTSRISDLRHAGYVITATRRPKGLTIYTLETPCCG